MNDLVSKNEVVNIANDFTFTFEGDRKRYMDFLNYCLNNVPTVEAKPVVHGKWEYLKEYNIVSCSECGEIPDCFEPSFCPNCGADMRKKVR
jgi:hypothetical protein